MVGELIDGRAQADEIRARLAAKIRELGAGARRPGLAVLLVGNDPASEVYVRAKVRRAEDCGFYSVKRVLPNNAAEQEVLSTISEFNNDERIDGILVQLPLPSHIDSSRVVAQIDPEKDVDGLTDMNVGRLASGKPGLRPCTPLGCVLLTKSVRSDLSGAHVVILGRSVLVGRPAAQLFLSENCTVTIAHSKSRNLGAICNAADILVVAIGKPEFVPAAWIRPGALVIDVGINRIASEGGAGGALVGDVDFARARDVAGAITPVPGGVGPMTIACLLSNTMSAYMGLERS